ncbi:hypothetical protein NC653_019993 [Populus alba x Populus x berolinensis]|uniref:Uncharacterized protein n=1 Tax=Populus alba x Populus x berolinensis TaxID=444605 RepID=A0AAD6QDZ5_9ROSI|nr:hypothetical protein NC653_019993 [Populus alba x Populus x berolinensis]
MAGNVRYELSSASPEELGFTGSYSNGQRGSYPNASFDRSGSFRESSESRMLSSGASTPRASASPARSTGPLTQHLSLDLVTMGDPKYTRTGELKRAFGISLGSATEDNSFGAAHSKPTPAVDVEELKRIRAGVLDDYRKSRNRAKMWNENLLRLQKFPEDLNSKNQQRSEMLMNERSGGSNFLKMGTQIHRNPSDLGTQRLEDRTKTIVLNKRVRSSIAESRVDGRSNTVLRQPLVTGKDRDIHRDGEVSNLSEEKVRRLPAGGEGWDKKMKKKRSVGTVFTRTIDSDGEVKRMMHHKFNNEHSLQSYDAQGFRSGSSNGSSGMNKVDGISSSANSNTRAIPKESEKVSLTRDYAAGMNKERLVVKANNKVNITEDNNHTVSPSPVTKGKASRTPRTSSLMAASTSTKTPLSPGGLDGWEQPPAITKVNSVGGPNNRKRPMPTGSSSPPMAKWVGQRPQKISRTRRVNVVSPVSNHDEGQMSSERGHVSDFATRVTSGIDGPPLAKDVLNGTTQVRVKHENVSSPSRLSESEESGAGENREGKPKDKRTGSGRVEERSLNQNAVPSLLITKKNKTLGREDTGDGVRRQGRTGRGPSSRTNISPMREKLENPASTKPLRNMRPISDKSGSKTGRPPLKKISDRKAFTRLGQIPISGSPDFSGESDDDREELLAAANFACNASFLSCSGSFWKKMEPVFAPICSGDSSYLKQQLKSVEDLHKRLYEMFDCSSNSGDFVLEEDIPSQLIHEESERNLQDQDPPKKLGRTSDLVDPKQDNSAVCGGSRTRNKVTPLYQRVLSALIVEDGSEEFAENSGGRNISFQCTGDSSPGDDCLSVDFEPGSTNGIDFNYESMLGFQRQKQSSVDGFSCNGNSTVNRIGGFHNNSYNDHLVQGGNGFMHSKTGMFPGSFENNDEKSTIHSNAFSMAAYDCQYEQLGLEDKLLMELQSVGLYPETVPDLADGEDEAINEDIIELQKKLQQVGKKEHLDNLNKAVEEGRELQEWPLEQVAMDRLVELAHRKQVATRGNNASKFGVPKVSKQVALAFTRRTLAKCRKFEDTGKSCFCEPPLRDVIFAAPRAIVVESTSCIQDPGASGTFTGRADRHDLHNDKFGRGVSLDHDFGRTGPLLNRGRKKELLLDDVGGNALFKTTSSLGNTLLGGAKGKRSERERDKDVLARNSVTRAGRASQSNIKGDRKTKSKPKQKIAQLSASGDGIINKFKETGSNKKREVGATSKSSNPADSSKESRGATNIAEFQDLDSIELHEGNDFSDTQDLNSLFDGLPENDFAER